VDQQTERHQRHERNAEEGAQVRDVLARRMQLRPGSPTHDLFHGRPLAVEGRVCTAAVADPFASEVYWAHGAAASGTTGLIAATDSETHAALASRIARYSSEA
jgi:hypothetical protein